MATKKKNSLSKASGKRTLSEISHEMAKPRVTASARSTRHNTEAHGGGDFFAAKCHQGFIVGKKSA